LYTKIKQEIPKDRSLQKKLIVYAILLIVLVGGGWVVTQKMLPRIQRLPIFKFQEMVAQSTEHISEEEIKGLIHAPLGENIFEIDLNALTANVKKHPWVEKAHVFRLLPNKLRIEVEEKKPVALLSSDESYGKLYFLDSKGIRIAPIRPRENVDFPIISGVSGPQVSEKEERLILEAYDVMALYHQNNFLKDIRLSEIHWKESVGFTFFTEGPSFEIRLGKEDFLKKFSRLERVLKDLAQKTVTPTLIDLNFTKKVVVKVAK